VEATGPSNAESNAGNSAALTISSYEEKFSPDERPLELVVSIVGKPGSD